MKRVGDISTVGYTVLEGLYGANVIATIATTLERIWRASSAPALYARQDRAIAEGIEVTPVGFTVERLLQQVPDLAELFFHPELQALFCDVLGPGHELEMVSGIMSDHTRPFFFWHNHVGGIDGEDYRRRDVAPPTRCDRLACTIYATPLDDEHGVMLVLPRRVGQPVPAPSGVLFEPWPGTIEVRAPAGSVVVIDEHTWHAVTPMRREGTRFLVGSFVHRAGIRTVREDPGARRAAARGT